MKKFIPYPVLLTLLSLIPGLCISQGSTAGLFYDNGDTVYVQSGGILHVQGDVVNVSGGSSSFTNDGLLNVEGDFTNNGTFKTDGSVGEGTVRLVGNSTMAGSATSGVQTLSGTLATVGTGSFYNLVIDRGTSGSLVSLANNVTVTGSLVWNGSSTTASTYNTASYPSTLGNSTVMQVRGVTPSGNGLIQTASNQIYTTNNAANAIAGYTSTAYINGYLERAVGASKSYDLPVGTSTYYELANITFSAGLTGTNNLTANFTPGVTTQPTPSTCIIDGTKMSALLNGGFWTIHPDVQPTAGTYTSTLNMIGYTNAPSAGVSHNGGTVTPAEQIGLVKRTNGATSWLGCGPTVYGNPATDQGLGTATDNATISGGVATVIRTSVPSFSDFGIGIEQNNNEALPVKMESFTAAKDGDHSSLLQWATASELGNAYFEVERSADATTWENIGQVKGAGTSVQEHSYNFIDASPFDGINYYRLKQVDVDGNFTYTNIADVTFDGISSSPTVNMYPNPLAVASTLTIQVSNTSSSASSNVTITNAMGQVVYNNGYESNLIQLNGLNLAAGVYYVSVTTDGAKTINSELVVK